MQCAGRSRPAGPSGRPLCATRPQRPCRTAARLVRANAAGASPASPEFLEYVTRHLELYRSLGALYLSTAYLLNILQQKKQNMKPRLHVAAMPLAVTVYLRTPESLLASGDAVRLVRVASTGTVPAGAAAPPGGGGGGGPEAGRETAAEGAVVLLPSQPRGSGGTSSLLLTQRSVLLPGAGAPPCCGRAALRRTSHWGSVLSVLSACRQLRRAARPGRHRDRPPPWRAGFSAQPGCWRRRRLPALGAGGRALGCGARHGGGRGKQPQPAAAAAEQPRSAAE